MATSTKFVFFLLLPLFLSSSSNARSLKSCMFDAIYNLGASKSDTGNFIYENPNSTCSRLPYGETLFKNVTGRRCSDGLLMIDYFALDVGLPLLNPYLNKAALTNHGVNFAVAGSTALPSKVLLQKNIFLVSTNSSLKIQLDWMISHLNFIYHNQIERKTKLRNALFFVGEIGGNDYNYALLSGKTLREIKDMVPQVVQAIKSGVERVISYGATRIIVPGNFPIGCFSVFLTAFQTNDTTAYDELCCLKDLNNFTIYHNDQIKQFIEVLRKENPHAIIVYGDYYNAFLGILRRASVLGFDEASLQKSCCGIGGNYNFNLTKTCGNPEVPVCPNPNDHISWDGLHLTQNAHKFIAQWLIDDMFPKLLCTI